MELEQFPLFLIFSLMICKIFLMGMDLQIWLLLQDSKINFYSLSYLSLTIWNVFLVNIFLRHHVVSITTSTIS
jgi:hypothetical protein